MPTKDELLELIQFNPIWRKGDPGPDWPWIFQELGSEVQVELVLSQLQYQKEVAAAQSTAIDRNIAILKAHAGAKKP
jgi:hypothetical protein